MAFKPVCFTMYPEQFTSLDEILERFKHLARYFTPENNRILSQIFYDTYKLAFYGLKRKEAHLKKPPKKPLRLKRNEVTRLLNLIHYHYSNNKVPPPNHWLTQCFGHNFTEEDALRFFEEFVEGEVTDKFGRKVKIDMENGFKFMYKDEATGRHKIESQFYKPERGKRLPWVKHTLTTSTNIYQKVFKDTLEIMYVTEYQNPLRGGKTTRCFWIVIAKKYFKDKQGSFNFATAFPVFRYNRLLKRLEEYNPAKQQKSLPYKQDRL